MVPTKRPRRVVIGWAAPRKDRYFSNRAARRQPDAGPERPALLQEIRYIVGRDAVAEPKRARSPGDVPRCTRSRRLPAETSAAYVSPRRRPVCAVDALHPSVTGREAI